MIKRFSIVCLGDSLTVGYQSYSVLGSNNGTPYTFHLETMVRTYINSNGISVNAVIINKGINGDSTDGMISRLPSILTIEKPNLLILWAGINDLSAGRKPHDIIKNIAEIVRLCTNKQVSTVICGLTPVAGPTHLNEMIRELNELIYGFCEAQKIIYVDTYEPLSGKEGGLDPANSNDGVHLSNRGYRIVSEKVYESIKPILKSLK